MPKIIKKAFGDNSHYKLFRYPYDNTQIHEGNTINNEKIVIKWIGNDQEELYFYNNCLTKVKEMEPNLRVYQIDKNKDLVIGWKRKDEATPKVELTINGVKEQVLTASNQEVTPNTILHIGDKIHFSPTASSNIQRYNTEAHDPDSITWAKAKTITDYGEIQLNYQKVELTSIDQDPKTPFNIVNNSKANIVITNPYDNNKVVHTGDAVFYKHNFFHATMNENYVFDPEGSHFIELVDKSANLYRITDNNPYFNIKYAGKVKIVIQDPSNYNAEYRASDGGLISNNDMMLVGSIIKIRLARDNVDLKDMPEHTTLVSQTFWNTNDDPYDLRKDYNVKINEEEDLTTITLKPPQPTPSTVFKTNANKYNDKVTVESHINHVTADPLPSDPTWFSQFEVVKISFKGNYGETGYKIDSVQNAIHCGEDYYQANGAECIINISEVSDYKLHILKSAPGATAEECGVYDMEVQNKKYPDGAILSLNKIIRIIPQENFIIDQDRLADLELVDSNMSSYKVTGLNPTVATKVAPFVTVTNENPDQIVIRTTKYPQITLSTYPDNTHVRLDNQITVDIDSPNRRSFKIIHSGLEYLNFSDYYKVIGMNVNVKIAPKKPPLQIKLSGPNIENAVYNDSISRGVENNDPVYEGERIMFKYPNGFTTLTEVVGLDVLSEAPGYRNTYIVKEDATEVKLTWVENGKAHLNNTTPQIIVVSTVETEEPEAITDFPENVLHIGERFKVAYFYSVEHPENYEIKATNAKFLEVDENDGARIYKITGANPTVKAIHKPKNVTVYIPNSDNTKYTVLQEDDTPITDGAILKSGQSFKIKMINKNYEYTSDSIIDCTLSSTSHYGDNIPIYTFTIKEDIVADSITIPPPTGGATVVLNILPDGNSDKLTVTAIDDSNRLITTFPDNSLHLGERFKAEVKSEFSNYWKVKDVFNGSKDSDKIWKVAGDPCNIILNKLFHLTVYTAGGNDPNEITFYKTKEGLDENIINDISLIKFSIHDRIHFRLCKWVEVDTDNSNLITHVNEENGVLTYFVDGEGCTLRTKLKNNVYMISVDNAADGVGHVYRENGTTLIDNHYYVEKDEIVVVKVEDPKIVPDVTQLELVSHENNTYKFKVLSGAEYPSISLNDHTPVLIDSNHPDWITVRKDDSTGPVLTLPDNTTFCKYMNVQMSIELKDEFDPRCYEISTTGVIEYGPGQYREKESPIEEDVHITVTLTKGVLHILKSSPSSTEEEFDLVDPDNALHVYNAEDAYPIGTKMKFVPKNPKYKVDLDRCKDVSYDSGIFTITGSSPTVASKLETNVIINIPTPNDLVYEVLKDDGSVISNGTALKAGDAFKVKLKKKFFKYEANSITDCTLTNTEEQTDTHLPIYTFKINSDITATSVTIPYPTETNKVKLDVEHADQIHVLAVEDGNKLISVFPDQSIHVGEKIKASFKSTELQELWEIKSITNATQDGENWVLTGPECKIITEKKKAHITIKHSDKVTVTAESDGREIHDGDTSMTTTELIKIIPKRNWKITPALLKGLEATADPNKFTIINKEVEIDVEEEPLVTIDSPKAYLFNINPDGGPIINTFPNSTILHMNEGFYIAFKTPSLKPKYDLQVTGATLMGETVSGIKYKVTDSNVIVDASLKPLPVTVRIPDETHVTVTKESNGDAVHDGDHSLLVNDKINIVIDRGYKFKLPLYGLTAESGTLYKIIGEEVIIKVEAIPFTTIDNQSPAILKVSTTDVPPVELTTFPNSNTIHEGDEFTVEFKDSANIPKYTLSVTGADLVSGTKYKATTTNVVIKAERIISTATFILTGKTTVVQTFKEGNPLNHGDHIQMYEIFEVRKKNTFCTVTVTGADLVPAHPGTTELISFYKVQEDVTQVVVHTEEAPYATINNVSTDLLSIKTIAIPPVEITVFPDNTSIHVNEEFTIKFKNAVDAPKYNIILSGAEFISGTKYKAISTNVTIRAELKPIPATLHVVGGDANVNITAVNDGRVLHDGDTSLVVNDQIKIVPKYGYKLKDGHITGGEELDAVNHIYKITEASVTVEVEAIPFAIIDNQSPTVLFVKTIVGASVELSTFPNSDTIHVDEEFAVGFKLASNKDKYNLIITGATQIAGNIYKATTNNIVVKAESKFPPATIHIIDGDHVDVADAMSGRVILDNDTSLFVGDKITVIPKSGYRLKQKVGLELLSKPSKLYKIANASVTIEVEEIPTPPAPPPGSTHNTILWYLKSLFYGGV